MRTRHRIAAIAAAVAALTAATITPAAAYDGYDQDCGNGGKFALTNGTLCVDIAGQPDQYGTIGVGYWRNGGTTYIDVSLGYLANGRTYWHPDGYITLAPGQSTTGTKRFNSWLNSSCVQGVMLVHNTSITYITGKAGPGCEN
ncbi:hypothetical protein Kfla_3927 [Kribbella flavida DSM 17836]|uniref:Secreted protein n=1 Tax=Kribbella flavida (strain DSM 17836 / JCM 10339 / NBRC 14399) TaxID=479435 RepID=D2PR31_KRIFD|nr:hypothetical protein [Kribbella flavida]ADB32979.1 hypothetical protein Kfla_3927 [Kribbella flavida DSM 17836]